MKTICLCGSSKWPNFHLRVMMEATLMGNIVIPMGLYGHADFPKGARKATNDADESGETKIMLNKLHFEKIKMSDTIIVITVDGYVGESTRKEIEYASELGKKIEFINFEAADYERFQI